MPNVLLLLAALAYAQEDPPGRDAAPASDPQKTVGEWLGLFEAEDGPDRLRAARVLKSQLRHALRVEAHGRPGTLAHDDARSLLVELEDRLPGAARVALTYPNTVALAAEMLAMLEIEDARPDLERALAAEQRPPVVKRIAGALDRLNSSP